MQVAVLFVRSDSVYKSLPMVDAWDEERDARRWPGGVPVVAHPPCRGWGRMRQFSYATEDELQLGLDAVMLVRQFGGVLEHPEASKLFEFCELPRPGQAPDAFGGWTLQVRQFDWGHRAEKLTWLYVVGVSPEDVGAMPVREGSPTHCVRPSSHGVRLPSITKREREATPPEFARWLVDLAARCRRSR